MKTHYVSWYRLDGLPVKIICGQPYEQFDDIHTSSHVGDITCLKCLNKLLRCARDEKEKASKKILQLKVYIKEANNIK